MTKTQDLFHLIDEKNLRSLSLKDFDHGILRFNRGGIRNKADVARIYSLIDTKDMASNLQSQTNILSVVIRGFVREPTGICMLTLEARPLLRGQ